MHSVFSQKYKNYRVIYIDDFSTDHTFEKVEKWIEDHNQEERTLLIRNERNLGALGNIYRAVHSCKDDEIVVTVDGDDFLAHDGVLSRLNEIYSDSEVWMTYGNYLDYPSYKQKPEFCKKIPEKVVRQNSYRSSEWVSTHLRTFYAGLFKKIKLQDLFFHGRFFPMGWDVAFMMPLLEMAGKHTQFVKETLYLYNRTNPISDHQINFKFQTECSNYVRKLTPYPRLKNLPFEDHDKEDHADLLVFSYDRPLQLYALLESVQQQIKGIHQIVVLYRTSSGEYLTAYQEVQRSFPSVQFVLQSQENDFQPLVTKILKDSSANFVLFAVDDIVVKDKFDLHECMAAMGITQAWGFFLGLSPHVDQCYMTQTKQGIPPLTPLTQNLFAWQFVAGAQDWKYPNSLDMVLYRKQDIEKDFANLQFENPNDLEEHWALKSRKRRIGLCYDNSKCVNLPINLVHASSNRHMNRYSTRELLEKFKKGLKMDVSPFLHITNHSRHVEADIAFTSRK